MTIVKASEDYTPYMPKPTQDLDHVLEIYNFTPSLTTGDIIHAFGMFDPDSMYVVWLNDTHALLVLGSAIQGNDKYFSNFSILVFDTLVLKMYEMSFEYLTIQYKSQIYGTVCE